MDRYKKDKILAIKLSRDDRNILLFSSVQFSSIQFSRSVLSNSLRPHGLHHVRHPYPSPTSRVYSNSSPLNRWCPPTISSCCFLLLLPSIFPSIRECLTSSLHQVGKVLVLASASVLPMNIQDWFPLGWTGFTSLQSKGLSRVVSNTTVQQHQLFSIQLSL